MSTSPDARCRPAPHETECLYRRRWQSGIASRSLVKTLAFALSCSKAAKPSWSRKRRNSTPLAISVGLIGTQHSADCASSVAPLSFTARKQLPDPLDFEKREGVPYSGLAVFLSYLNRGTGVVIGLPTRSYGYALSDWGIAPPIFPALQWPAFHLASVLQQSPPTRFGPVCDPNPRQISTAAYRLPECHNALGFDVSESGGDVQRLVKSGVLPDGRLTVQCQRASMCPPPAELPKTRGYFSIVGQGWRQLRPGPSTISSAGSSWSASVLQVAPSLSRTRTRISRFISAMTVHPHNRSAASLGASCHTLRLSEETRRKAEISQAICASSLSVSIRRLVIEAA